MVKHEMPKITRSPGQQYQFAPYYRHRDVHIVTVKRDSTYPFPQNIEITRSINYLIAYSIPATKTISIIRSCESVNSITSQNN